MAKNGPFDADRLEGILAGEVEPRSEDEREVAALALSLKALGEADVRPEFFSALEERLLLEPEAESTIEDDLLVAASSEEAAELLALARALKPLPAITPSQEFVESLEHKLLSEPSKVARPSLLAAFSDMLRPIRSRAAALEAVIKGAAKPKPSQAGLFALASALAPLPATAPSAEFVDMLEARLMSEPMEEPSQRSAARTLGWRFQFRAQLAGAMAAVLILAMAIGRIALDGPLTPSIERNSAAPNEFTPNPEGGLQPLDGTSSSVSSDSQSIALPQKPIGNEKGNEVTAPKRGAKPAPGDPIQSPPDQFSGVNNTLSNQQKALLDGMRHVLGGQK